MPLPERRHNPQTSHIHPREYFSSPKPEIPPPPQLLKAVDATQEILATVLKKSPLPEDMMFDFSGDVKVAPHHKKHGITIASIRGISTKDIPPHLLHPEVIFRLLYDSNDAINRPHIAVRTFIRKEEPRPEKGEKKRPLLSVREGDDNQIVLSVYGNHISDAKKIALGKELLLDLKRASVLFREQSDVPEGASVPSSQPQTVFSQNKAA